MDDRSCMYQVSLEELCIMDYCNGIESFINYALSNLKNISRSSIRCLYKRCKNKKFLNPDIVIMHLLQKKVHEKILMLICL